MLVNGAGGGVGTFAVQIAAALGAEVTGVCSTGNVELVRSIGAAHVIDYTTEEFTDGRIRYDVILDNVSSLPLKRGCEGRSPRRGPSCSTAAVRPATCSGRSPASCEAVMVNMFVSQRLRPLPSREDPGGAARRDRAHRGGEAHADG